MRPLAGSREVSVGPSRICGIVSFGRWPRSDSSSLTKSRNKGIQPFRFSRILGLRLTILARMFHPPDLID